MNVPSRGPMTVVAASIAVALSLVACSSAGGSSPSDGSTGASGAATAQGKSVIYVAPSEVGSYVAVSCGAEEMAQRYGLKYSVQYASTFSASAQIPLIDAAVAAHPDVLLVSAADPQALTTPLRQAAAQGIKVMTVANGINQSSFLTSAIAGDNKTNGVETADLLAKLAHGRAGDVAYIGYTPGGSAITDAREAGFEAEIKKYPNLHLLTPVIVGAVDANTGATATNAILSAHPDLLGIVGSFVNVSDGMAEALRERGEAGKVIALQMDSDPAGVANIINGSLQGLLGETFRTEGGDAVQQAVNALSAKPVSEQVSSPPVVFTEANASLPSMQQYITKTSC